MADFGRTPGIGRGEGGGGRGERVVPLRYPIFDTLKEFMLYRMPTFNILLKIGSSAAECCKSSTQTIWKSQD